ncbi:MAG: cytochrome b/b6 domain-containing protein [Xanthomonadales bacterium]|nr:cytochrome b/b6 domain-containing protein [Xanthomonadales bacterium]
MSTRIWHWINAITLVLMLMSGLMIFNAHPRLYWGEFGANPDHAWLEIGSQGREGYLRVADIRMKTTGFLGLWEDDRGRPNSRAFPHWATIPSYYSLALSRRWHLTFAWLFAIGVSAYGFWSLLNGHFRRDLLPGLSELKPAHLWRDIKRHVTLDFPKGAAAISYNTLQKLSYLGVFLMLAVLVLTGLTMSPAMDAVWPWLLDLFGGRQSARSIHFIAAVSMVLFLVVHLLMVLLAGPINEIRSMITGWFKLPEEDIQ